MTETKKDTLAGDPAETAREFIEKGGAAGRAYAEAVGAATIAGLRTAFELQNATIAAATAAVKAGQSETIKLAEAGKKLVETTLTVKV